MITAEQYFQAKPHSAEQDIAADDLLVRVNELLDEAERLMAFRRVVCPNTGSEVSGSKGGTGDGGFRLPTSTTGSPHSSHKEARAVDVYDPGGHLDDWLDDFEQANGGNTMLENHGLYREAPDSTTGWCHLTTRPPHSGKRTFHP